jgi:hypothetical protein
LHFTTTAEIYWSENFNPIEQHPNSIPVFQYSKNTSTIIILNHKNQNMETPNRTKSYYKWAFSNELAIGSFAIGTLLLLILKVIPYTGMMLYIGLCYVLFAIVINSVMLFYLIFLCIILPDERENLALKIIFLLCNIPIAILYLYTIFTNY